MNLNNDFPNIFYVSEFLAPADCERLRLEVSSVKSLPALIVKRHHEEINEEFRRTKYANPSEGTVAFIQESFDGIKPNLEEYFGVKLGLCEQPQFLVYREGDFFYVHQDASEYSEYPPNIRDRQVSVVLFLNDQSIDPKPNMFGGGTLTLYDLSETTSWKTCRTFMSAKRGLLVAFPAKQFHQVTKIRHGERFTVVSWFPLALL